MAQKVTVAKGVKLNRDALAKIKKGEGSSNAGKYKNVSKDDFAGASGGASSYSYPMDTIKRGRSAIRLSGNAPDPKGIREAVYKKYPSLRPKKKKGK